MSTYKRNNCPTLRDVACYIDDAQGFNKSTCPMHDFKVYIDGFNKGQREVLHESKGRVFDSEIDLTFGEVLDMTRYDNCEDYSWEWIKEAVVRVINWEDQWVLIESDITYD